MLFPSQTKKGSLRETRSANTSHKNQQNSKKIYNTDKSLPQDALQFVKRARDGGAGSWLTALPLDKLGFTLNKSDFRDALRLRYNIPITDIPSYCVCGERSNVIHVLSCKKAGFVSQRHDNVRDLFTTRQMLH